MSGRRRGRLEFSRRRPGLRPIQILWFDLSEALCRLVLKILYRFRIVGAERVPSQGPCIFVCNHQSLLDPVINGCAVIDRQLTAMAREGLFRFKPFAWLMRSYGAIALKDTGGDSAAFKAALGELRAGRSILIYPEGSRTLDGCVHTFQAGVALLIRRAQVQVVPLGIEGAYEVWPRGRSLPSLTGRIEVEVGEPIAFESLPLDAPTLLPMLRERVLALVERRRVAMLRSGWRPPRLRHLWPRSRGRSLSPRPWKEEP